MAYAQTTADLPSAATVDAAMKRAHQLRSDAFHRAVIGATTMLVKSIGSMASQRPFLTMTRPTHQASPCQ